MSRLHVCTLGAGGIYARLGQTIYAEIVAGLPIPECRKEPPPWTLLGRVLGLRAARLSVAGERRSPLEE